MDRLQRKLPCYSSTDQDRISAKIERPKVSVIMPVRNEERHIADTLQHLLDQEHAGFGVEILVADGRSTDRTREIVQSMSARHNNIRLLDNPARLSSSARNIAIENSRGEFLVLIDGHCEIRSRRYFVDLVDAFERTGADCLGRPQPLDVSEASPLQQAIAAARNSPLGHHPDSHIFSDEELKVPALSVAIAYRRHVFDQLGMFDTSFDACEDCDMNHRIDQHGMSCFLVPKLAVHYQPRGSLRGLFRQLTRYGQGRVRLARKHADSLALSSIIPALFLLGLVLGPLVCYVLPVFWPVYWGVVLLYVVLVIGFSLQAAVKSGIWRSVLWLPAVFLTIHLGSGWGVVKEFLLGLKTEKGTGAKNA